MNDQNKPKTVDICPILSMGKFEPVSCMKERCAWYEPCDRRCAVLDITYSIPTIG